MTIDGASRGVLGANEDAETVTGIFGGVISLVALDDGSLAFVNVRYESPLDGTFELRVLSGAEIELVGSSTHEVDPDTESVAAPLRKVASGPDGRLVTVDGPQITLLDVGTEDEDILLDLESESMPRSAALDGTDLLFIADERLWRKPDVVS